MRVLIWHVHGGWLDGFVRGPHDILLPFTADEGLGGRDGRDWPPNAVEVPLHRLGEAEPDIVVLQRPEEVQLAALLTGRTPGVDLPAVYLEHNTPGGRAATTRHPLADHPSIPIVHVTHFNRLMWDTGSARTVVIEHGVRDPGYRYSGEHREMAAVINEAVRRGRTTGSDLLPRFAQVGPVRLYGIDHERGAAELGLLPGGNWSPAELHADLPRRRLYLHPARWTSLGLSLIEAMLLGMPVVALAATEVPRAVPPEAGAVSSDVDELLAMAGRLLDDPGEAQARGRVAREAALERFGLSRFLDDWNQVLDDTLARAGRLVA